MGVNLKVPGRHESATADDGASARAEGVDDLSTDFDEQPTATTPTTVMNIIANREWALNDMRLCLSHGWRPRDPDPEDSVSVGVTVV
jgi:hypothetical protein